ncbi:hypothetical protein R3P38DRAFT_2607706 [Favolaschia claudopus]|uniref:Uncharacterized protein n=1 Tax=Favolaschia claudopus TaxID=2862362 RepID=A0AAW0D647_9AGAR
MGGFWSCCRRDKSPERDPLLPKHKPVENAPHSGFEKLADIVGAVNSGKLPSQDQLSALLQLALRSELLRDPRNALPSHGGPLSQRMVTLVVELRGLVEAALRIGLEKNYDNRLQDLLYHSSQTSDPIKVGGELLVDGSLVKLDSATTQEISTDADEFLRSLKALSKLGITSSAFRVLVSDILSTTREIVAEAAVEVGQVASQVQAAAVDVAQAVELNNVTAEGLKGKAQDSLTGIQQSVGHAHRNLGTLGDDSTERIRDIIVGRVQEIVIQTRNNPEHRTALGTILRLLRKYSQALNDVAESSENPVIINTDVDVSTPLFDAAVDFKVILERFASGFSLDPLLRIFKSTVIDILTAPTETSGEVKRYFADLNRWFERALAEPQFVSSRLGTRTLEELYDAGILLLASEAHAQWAQDVRLLLAEAQTFVHALEEDVATQRLIKSLHNTISAFRGLSQDAVISGARAQHKLRNELLRDALAWVLPRVLKSLHQLPMPRVEFRNSLIDVAVDALLLTSASTSASLAPDHFWMQNWNEIKVNMVENGSPETSSRTRIHIDGLRCAAHGFGYYLNYKGLLGYSDEGVLDVDVGRPDVVGQGLGLDLELETTQEERETPGEPLFRVTNVNVSIPGLAFTIKYSKHWILNNLLVQPLAAPIVRLVLQKVLEQQIRNAVGWADRLFSATSEEAQRINARSRVPAEAPSMEDYWNAALLTTPAFVENRDPGPTVETRTQPTFKGIIHTTTTLPADPSASSPLEETVVAIGGDAQLFPGKGGPYGTEEVTTADVAREVVGEIQETVRHSVGKAKEVVEAVEDDAVQIRSDLERAQGRKMDRERFEKYRGGWRSNAFDVDFE